MFRIRSHTSCLRTSHLLWSGWLALWLAVSLPVDGQVPTDQVKGVQADDGSRVSAVRGLGVFGNALGIHGQDSLMVNGDLVLDHADVVGNGVLILKSCFPQHLVSRHSRLNNLLIDNPTRVELQGELRLEKSLTVDKGVFDMSAGDLERGATCHIRLLRGARFSNQLIWTVQNTDSETHLTDTERLVGLSADGISSPFGCHTKPQQRPNGELSGYRFIAADTIEPPPKVKPD